MDINSLIQNNFTVAAHPNTSNKFPLIKNANKMIPRQCDGKNETHTESILIWILCNPKMAVKLTKERAFSNSEVLDIIENEVKNRGFVKTYLDEDYFEYHRI